MFFVNIRSKNTQFYKDEIFIPQNPKKKEKKNLKYMVLFTQAFLAPVYPHNMQIFSIINYLCHNYSILVYSWTIGQYNIN